MTNSEMKYEFDLLYDAMYSGTSPGFSIRAKSVFLTEAQEELVLEILGYDPTFKKKYDEDSIRKIGLGGLLSAQSNISVNYNPLQITSTLGRAFRNKSYVSAVVELPDDYMYPITEMGTAYLSINEPTDDKLFNVRVVDKTQSNVLFNLDNPFKNPTNDLIWKIQSTKNENIKRIELIHNTAILLYSFYIKYLKYPTPIVLEGMTGGSIDGVSAPTDSILEPIHHRDIIKRAVTKARASLNDVQGYQISKNEETQ